MYSRFEYGVEKIKKEDRDLQRKYLEVLAGYRFMDIEYLLDLGCFFVPNPEYLIEMFGSECIDRSYDFYTYEGECKWLGQLLIPIRGVYDNIVGFVGYNPANKLISEDNRINGTDYEVPPKYTVSTKAVFDRDKFLLIPNGYKKILEDDYVIVVDGVFDALTLASLGFNSACNLGTSFSKYASFLLSFPKRRYVAQDNDNAGLQLFNSIKRQLPNTCSIMQNKYKDIDEYISKEGFKNFTEAMSKSLNSPMFTTIIL